LAVLTFVTSIRAKALATNWDRHLRLLERTLASCLAQTDPDIPVNVVGHERPAVRVSDPRLRFIEVDLPLPRREHAELVIDKVLKISVGAQAAIDEGSRFVMYADADDLVSRRLASFARESSDANGWYFPDGYSHRYGQPWLKRSHEQHLVCGTCAIFRADLLQFAHSAEYRGGWVNTLAAAGHNEYQAVQLAQARPLAPLPFPGSIYIQHGDSLATMVTPEGETGAAWRVALRSLRRAARELATVAPLTPHLAREFTIARAAL